MISYGLGLGYVTDLVHATDGRFPQALANLKFPTLLDQPGSCRALAVCDLIQVTTGCRAIPAQGVGILEPCRTSRRFSLSQSHHFPKLNLLTETRKEPD